MSTDGIRLLDTVLCYVDYLLLDKPDYKGYEFRKNLHIASYGVSIDKILFDLRVVKEKNKYGKMVAKTKLVSGKQKEILREMPNLNALKGLTVGEREILQRLITECPVDVTSLTSRKERVRLVYNAEKDIVDLDFDKLPKTLKESEGCKKLSMSEKCLKGIALIELFEQKGLTPIWNHAYLRPCGQIMKNLFEYAERMQDNFK